VKGGAMTADEIDEKTGDSVAEVLESKHPEAKIPDVRHLPTYAERPVLTDVDVTPNVVEHVASRLTGSAGLGGSDAHALGHWLLKFGASSQRLRLALGHGWPTSRLHGLLFEHSWQGDSLPLTNVPVFDQSE
jgi:hypothetical protein